MTVTAWTLQAANAAVVTVTAGTLQVAKAVWILKAVKLQRLEFKRPKNSLFGF
jgi:hypothetical protein